MENIACEKIGIENDRVILLSTGTTIFVAARTLGDDHKLIIQSDNRQSMKQDGSTLDATAPDQDNNQLAIEQDFVCSM